MEFLLPTAVLQFEEENRKIQIVQNLTSTRQTYRGNLVAGSTHAIASLHRSWSESVTSLDASTGAVVVTENVPAYGHIIAVSSNEPDDHSYSHCGSEEVYGKGADLKIHKHHSLDYFH